MTTIAFPVIRNNAGPSSLVWRKISNTQVHESPLTRSVQTMALPGARWACAATWENLSRDDAAVMRAFLASLRGRAGRFYLWHLGRPTSRGNAAGVPVVYGGGQTGASINTHGWSAGASLRAGDMIGIGTELRMQITDATADGAGLMTLTFDEPVRASPANNAPVITSYATCAMRLSGDDFDSSFAPARAGPVETFSLDCVETWS